MASGDLVSISGLLAPCVCQSASNRLCGWPPHLVGVPRLFWIFLCGYRGEKAHAVVVVEVETWCWRWLAVRRVVHGCCQVHVHAGQAGGKASSVTEELSVAGMGGQEADRASRGRMPCLDLSCMQRRCSLHRGSRAKGGSVSINSARFRSWFRRQCNNNSWRLDALLNCYTTATPTD